MATLGGGQVKEGFICPICMQDFHTTYQLTSHFEDVHKNEDNAKLQQVKVQYTRIFVFDVPVHYVLTGYGTVSSEQ